LGSPHPGPIPADPPTWEREEDGIWKIFERVCIGRGVCVELGVAVHTGCAGSQVLDPLDRFRKGSTMVALKVIAYVLVLVGALNWGLWGIAQFDLVATLFGGNTAVLSRVVYSLVGIAAVVLAVIKIGEAKNAGGALVSA